MRRLGLLVLLMVWMTGCSAVTSATPEQEIQAIVKAYPELNSHAWTKEVVKRTVDGDTLETEKGDKVRLIGVNTPETVKPNSPVEAYGKEASSYSKAMLTGKTIYMFKDTGNQDQYGRLLRYIFIAGETVMYNETLLAEGYANTMSVPPNVMYQTRFLEIERTARTSGKGLWAGPGSESSDGKTAAACSKPTIKGNINSSKEKIYHVPGGRYYEQTQPEALFCTEQEAQAAGFRKSKE